MKLKMGMEEAADGREVEIRAAVVVRSGQAVSGVKLRSEWPVSAIGWAAREQHDRGLLFAMRNEIGHARCREGRRATRRSETPARRFAGHRGVRLLILARIDHPGACNSLPTKSSVGALLPAVSPLCAPKHP